VCACAAALSGRGAASSQTHMQLSDRTMTAIIALSMSQRLQSAPSSHRVVHEPAPPVPVRRDRAHLLFRAGISHICDCALGSSKTQKRAFALRSSSNRTIDHISPSGALPAPLNTPLKTTSPESSSTPYDPSSTPSDQPHTSAPAPSPPAGDQSTAPAPAAAQPPAAEESAHAYSLRDIVERDSLAAGRYLHFCTSKLALLVQNYKY